LYTTGATEVAAADDDDDGNDDNTEFCFANARHSGVLGRVLCQR